MRISSNKITASEEIDVNSNRGYLFQCLDDEIIDPTMLCRELLHFISETDAEDIINAFELNYHEDEDEYDEY